jgi:hypothetical protein
VASLFLTAYDKVAGVSVIGSGAILHPVGHGLDSRLGHFFKFT